ncbi:MAG: hypothetical protein GF331_26195 [Chitinivibrionales bacterium]|nr:hypothetical protein [Chitinivibrionales bacterium]
MTTALPTPRYRDAAYGGESMTLENDLVRLVFHKRPHGWGWGELYARNTHTGDRFLGVLEYLAEADIVGHEFPLRLEAEEYQRARDGGVQTLRFDVELQLPQEPWMSWDNFRMLSGHVVFTLDDHEPWIGYSLFVKPKAHLRFRYLRGAWLRVGADSFGAEKHDALFPGLEWLQDREWSSSTRFYPSSFAMKVTPHPYIVTAPLMAISHDGYTAAVSWATPPHATDNTCRIEDIQPVFAVPDFIDRRDESLMGLMYPGVQWGLKPNELQAAPSVSMPRGGLWMQAEITVQKGASLDALLAWVDRHGLPDAGTPRYEWSHALERMAQAYDTNLWENGKGFLRSWHLSPSQPYLDVRWENRADVAKRIPRVVSWYVERHPDTALAKSLRAKIEWCLSNRTHVVRDRAQARFGAGFDLFEFLDDNQLGALADETIGWQAPDGSFRFDPDGRHYTSHLEQARRTRPLGQPGDVALNQCVTSSLLLLLIGEILERDDCLQAARRALDFALPLECPDGGDWWETPLHSPNIMTAGFAAIAYHCGTEILHEEVYRDRALHFLRAILAFTNLWQPSDRRMAYHTKPLFGTTAWHAMDWTTRNIIWEILMIFDLSEQLGIDWSTIDTRIDWAAYQRGLATAGLEWLADNTDPAWMTRFTREKVDTSPQVLAAVRDGAYNMILSDNYDPVNDAFGGVGVRIPPDTLATSIIKVLERQEAAS